MTWKTTVSCKLTAMTSRTSQSAGQRHENPPDLKRITMWTLMTRIHAIRLPKKNVGPPEKIAKGSRTKLPIRQVSAS